MESSWAYETLKMVKVALIIISSIAVIELVIIGIMGYMLYDGQFEYTTEQVQEVENTSVDNSSITQY